MPTTSNPDLLAALDPGVLAELAHMQRNGRPGFMQRVIELYLRTSAELIGELETASVKKEPAILYRTSYTSNCVARRSGPCPLQRSAKHWRAWRGLVPTVSSILRLCFLSARGLKRDPLYPRRRARKAVYRWRLLTVVKSIDRHDAALSARESIADGCLHSRPFRHRINAARTILMSLARRGDRALGKPAGSHLQEGALFNRADILAGE